MSFILDALRKSDQLRQGQAVPTLSTLQPLPPARHGPPSWSIALAGLLLLTIGLVIGGWQSGSNTTPRPQAPVAPVTVSPYPPLAVTSPSAITKTPSEPNPNARPNTPSPSAPRKNTLNPASAQEPTQAPTQAQAHRRTTAADRPEHAPAMKAATDTLPMAAPASVPEEEAPPIDYEHLPPATLAELPKLSVTAHAYSKNPQARYVFIKDRMLHEGDTLAPGLVLEKITPKGMIFRYKAQRFQRGLQP